MCHLIQVISDIYTSVHTSILPTYLPISIDWIGAEYLT